MWFYMQVKKIIFSEFLCHKIDFNLAILSLNKIWKHFWLQVFCKTRQRFRLFPCFTQKNKKGKNKKSIAQQVSKNKHKVLVYCSLKRQCHKIFWHFFQINIIVLQANYYQIIYSICYEIDIQQLVIDILILILVRSRS